MSILVTGAGGFLGELLTNRLLEQGEEVHAMVHHSKMDVHQEQERLKIHQGDVEDPDSIRRIMEGCDRVYHLAALAAPWVKDPSLFHRVNVKGTEQVLKIAEELKVKRVLHTSSAATIGPQKDERPVTEEQLQPEEEALTEYERTKIRAEGKVRETVREGRIDALIVNPTRLYGPGPLKTSNAVTQMLRDHANGKWRIVPGNGKSVGNYVFTMDVIDGMIRAMEYGKSGENYLLGGENIDLADLFRKWADVTGHHRRMIRIPVPFLLATAHGMKAWASITGRPPLITPPWVRKYLQKDWAADISKARKELGYEPRSLKDGFQRTFEWLKVKGEIEGGREERMESSSS